MRHTKARGACLCSGDWGLDGRPLTTPGTLKLERVAWVLEEEPEAEASFVEVGVRLQVVTTASLGKVATWLTQGEKTDAERSALTRTYA